MERTRLSDVYMFSCLIVAISFICFSADGKVQNKDFPDTDASGDGAELDSSGDDFTESPITVSSETDHVQHQSHGPEDSKKNDSNVDSSIIPIDPTDAFTEPIQAESENDKNKHNAILEQGVPWSFVEEYSPNKMFMLAGTFAITVLTALSILWISFCVIFSLVQMKDYGKSKKKPEKKSDIPLDYEVCMPVNNLAYENVDANAYVYEEVVEKADSHKNEVPNADIKHSVGQKMSVDATNNTNVQNGDIGALISQQMTEETADNTTTVDTPEDVTSVNTTSVNSPVEGREKCKYSTVSHTLDVNDKNKAAVDHTLT